MRMATALLALVSLMITACAPLSDKVILLPGPDGHSGALLVSAAAGEIVLAEPYAGADVAGGKVTMVRSSAGMVRDDYGWLLDRQPARPRLFVVHFEPGTSVLTPASQPVFDSIRTQLAALPAGEAVVIGHTDRVGAVEANDRLSRLRAEEVREMLVSAGVSREDISVVGRGERAPAVATADEVAEPRNRRVEIKLR